MRCKVGPQDKLPRADAAGNGASSLNSAKSSQKVESTGQGMIQLLPGPGVRTLANPSGWTVVPSR